MGWWRFVAILVVSVAPAWGAPFAWLAHQTVNRAARIDLASHTTTSIVVAGSPFTTAASQDGLRAYTANGDQTVSVIDAPSATLLGNIPLGAPAAAIAVRADGARAYVPRGDGQLSVIDTATSTITATFSLGSSPSVGAIVANAAGTRAYVTKSEYPITSVAVIDTVADSFTSDVFLDNSGGFPLGVAVSADGTRVYATVFGVPAVFVVDGTSNLLLGTIPLSMDFGMPQPNGLAVSPDGSRVYATDGFNHRLAVLDVASETELTSIPVGQSPSVVDITPDGAESTSSTRATRA